MSRFIRRGRTAPAAVELAEDDGATDRRAFLRRSTGYAAAAAVPIALVGSADADASAARPANGVTVADPATQPDSPLMAYVQDAKAGTVVIMTGTTQRTVKDRELVRRLTTTTKKKQPKKRAKRKPHAKKKTHTTGKKG